MLEKQPTIFTNKVAKQTTNNITNQSKKRIGGNRKKVRKILNEIQIPKEMGLIVRTAGSNKTKNEKLRTKTHVRKTTVILKRRNNKLTNIKYENKQNNQKQTS